MKKNNMEIKEKCEHKKIGEGGGGISYSTSCGNQIIRSKYEIEWHAKNGYFLSCFDCYKIISFK